MCLLVFLWLTVTLPKGSREISVNIEILGDCQ
jgi:hypothetical protein